MLANHPETPESTAGPVPVDLTGAMVVSRERLRSALADASAQMAVTTEHAITDVARFVAGKQPATTKGPAPAPSSRAEGPTPRTQPNPPHQTRPVPDPESPVERRDGATVGPGADRRAASGLVAAVLLPLVAMLAFLVTVLFVVG